MYDLSGQKALDWTGLLSGAFQGMSNVISDALNSTENVFQSFWTFFKDFIKGMIIRLAAAAVAAVALAVALTAITGGSSTLGGALKGLSTFGDFFKFGFGKFAGVGMAEGGIIPPGYPNDSFPARLSSGEAVIPLDRLGEHAGAVEVNITPTLRGEDIYWIVEEVQRRIGNSSR